MKKMVFIVLLFSVSVLYAAGDYQAGEQKSMVCAACHGPVGISPNPEWPSLAGQHASYLVKQLQDFKAAKTRHDASMAPMVADLSEQDMMDLAEFYARQAVPRGVTQEKYLARGERLYRGGDFEQKITACIACHGPRGMGNAQANFPVLSGQEVPYTVHQLESFKNGKRSNDFHAIMRDISVRMSHEDMEAVASYLSGLH